MRINVLLSVVVLFLFCFQSTADAQGQRGQGNRVSRSALVMADAVQQELDLTEEQQEQLDEMRQAMRSQRGQRRRPGGNEGEGKRGEGKRGEGKRGEGKRGEGERGEGKRGEGRRGAGQQRNRGGVANLEQVQKEIDGLSEILLEHQMTRLNEIYVQAMGARAIQDPVISEALDISDDQKAQMQDLRAEMREELMALRDTMERSEIREKMMEMSAEANEKMLDVLSKKQTKKLAGMKGEAFDLPKDSNRPNRRNRDRTDF
ncbi:MAG: Spy/CpxP family protein refolding chaperone [Pirellulaceae bacterium]|nr:Spy/CpxP family protein refolding chaperone [Pirellulaceae bacterium]